MTTLASAPHPATAAAAARLRRPRPEPTPSRLPLAFLMFVVGSFMVVAGFALFGSSWILPYGVVGGGVSLIVAAPMARTMLDPLIVSSPFLFYVLAPGVGLLTAGSSDVLLPFFVGVVAVTAVIAPRAVKLPPVPQALPLIVLTTIVMLGSFVIWTIVSVDFEPLRAIADSMKLLIGFGYLLVIFNLARRAGAEGTHRALKLWTLTATLLSAASLVGATGAIILVPNDGYRSLGYFQDGNLYAGYLLVSLSIVFYLNESRRAWVTALQATLIVLGVVTTGSRGGMLSLAILLAFVALAINSAKIRIWLLCGLGAATAGFYWLLNNREAGSSIIGLDRLFFASDADTVADDPRFRLWARAVEKWQEQPLWGIGAGQFERFSADAYKTTSSGVGYVTHNSFLFFLVAYGVIGLALFLYFVGWVVKELYTASHLTRNAKQALGAGILMILTQMMTLNLQNQRFVWIYFAMVLAVALQPPSTEPAPADDVPAPPPHPHPSTRGDLL